MDDDVVKLAVIGRLVRRRWRLLTALAALGALIGFGLSVLISPGYSAASVVLLQGSRDKQQILTEAQIAMSLVVLDRVAAGLDWEVDGADLQKAVTASVTDGNVIEILAVAATTERAQLLAERTTAEYIAFSSQLVTDAVNAAAAVTRERELATQERIDELTEQAADLQAAPTLAEQSPQGADARAQLDQVRSNLAIANAELDDIRRGPQASDDEVPSGTGGITVIEQAAPRGAADPTPAQLVAGGALAFAILGVVGLLAAARSDRRLRDSDRIASAVGSPVLGGVDVVLRSRAGGTGASRSRTWLRDLLRDAPEWTGVPVQASRSSDDLRYRRVLGRLHGDHRGGRAVVVIVPDDDEAALQAVAELAAAAAADRTPVGLVTDSDRLAEMALTAAAVPGQDDLPLTVVGRASPGRSTARAEFHVAEVSADRPVLPDGGASGPTLVVVSVGTRTAWELVGLSIAARDAGHPVDGVLVVRSILASPAPAAAPVAPVPPGIAAAAATGNGNGSNGNGSTLAGTS